MLPKINPTTTSAWQLLQRHFEEEMIDCNLNDLFTDNLNRFDYYSIELDHLLFDYSKNLISNKTLQLLFQLAEEVKLSEGISAMFEGALINETENRAVLHTALRDFSGQAIYVDSQNIQPVVAQNRIKMKSFCDAVHSGAIKGKSGKKIRTIVNIGIGGSDLGPFMVTEALKPYCIEGINTFFVSNVDASDITSVLNETVADETIFLISSKTFKTQETILNANIAKEWFLEQVKDGSAIQQHFVAITQNKEAAIEFGINEDRIFEVWDWVCGRFSLWGSIGLSVALTIGYQKFEELLKGANAVDIHFQNECFDNNIPVIMALISVWYINFWQVKSEALLSYNHYLQQFAHHFQQGFMESNGKSIDRSGKRTQYQTGVVTWGGVGTDAQHSFFQLFHQGTQMIPVDFIASVQTNDSFEENQTVLLSNFFAQSNTFMKGRSFEEIKGEMFESGHSTLDIEQIGKQRIINGNKPSNTLLIKALNPFNLGSLIALYEHKIFVQGLIWNIFSFDQWGVELGKQVASDILSELQCKSTKNEFNSSLNGLMTYYEKWKNC